MHFCNIFLQFVIEVSMQNCLGVCVVVNKGTLGFLHLGQHIMYCKTSKLSVWLGLMAFPFKLATSLVTTRSTCYRVIAKSLAQAFLRTISWPNVNFPRLHSRCAIRGGNHSGKRGPARCQLMLCTTMKMDAQGQGWHADEGKRGERERQTDKERKSGNKRGMRNTVPGADVHT